MPPPDSLILFFRILGLVASVALFVRLARLDLIRKYRIFSAYLIFASIRTAAGFPFPSNSSAYFYLWRATEPIYWAFYLLLVGEVYSLVFQGYVGIRSLSRWALMAGVVLALLVSGVTIMPLFQERMPLSQVLFYYLRI